MQIDKEGAEPERVKQELAELQLLPEEWGGQTAVVPVHFAVKAIRNNCQLSRHAVLCYTTAVVDGQHPTTTFRRCAKPCLTQDSRFCCSQPHCVLSTDQRQVRAGRGRSAGDDSVAGRGGGAVVQPREAGQGHRH
jgi:hypothetical protein